MNEASQIAPPTAAAGHNRLRNPGVALEPAWFESVAVNASAVERRTASLSGAPLGQEGPPGRVAGARADLPRPDDARRRRHAGPRAPPVRQGAPAARRRPRRRARPRRRSADGRRGLRLSDDGRAGGQGARRLRHSGRLGRRRLSRRPDAAASCGSPRSNSRSARGRTRSTSSSPAPMCSTATGTRSTTRCRRCARPAGRRISRRSSPPATSRRCATSMPPAWWRCRPAPTSSRPRPARRTSTRRCRSAW